jgi:hypothetical protein
MQSPLLFACDWPNIPIIRQLILRGDPWDVPDKVPSLPSFQSAPHKLTNSLPLSSLLFLCSQSGRTPLNVLSSKLNAIYKEDDLLRPLLRHKGFREDDVCPPLLPPSPPPSLSS